VKGALTKEMLKTQVNPEQPVLDVVNVTKYFEINGATKSVLHNITFSAGVGEMI